MGVAVPSTEEFLTRVDYSEAVQAHIAAPPDHAFEAALAVTASEMWLSSALLMLRGLPAMVRRLRLPRRVSSQPFWDQIRRGPGFTPLLEPHDGYAAVGYVGRPWRPAAEPHDVPAREFAGFAEPGWAKVVMDLRAIPAEGGTLLRTETRIQLTDEHARRAFGRYWMVVRFGSNAIRRDWLRAAGRRAARGA